MGQKGTLLWSLPGYGLWDQCWAVGVSQGPELRGCRADKLMLAGTCRHQCCPFPVVAPTGIFIPLQPKVCNSP